MVAYTEADLLRIRDQHEDWLRQTPGFVGSGVGLDRHGRVCLKIYSDHMPQNIRQEILKRLGDVPTAVEETGRPRLQSPG